MIPRMAHQSINRSDYDMTMGEFVATLTEEQRAANKQTHIYDWEQLRCMECDCRPHGVWSVWPCGQEPPTNVAPWA